MDLHGHCSLISLGKVCKGLPVNRRKSIAATLTYCPLGVNYDFAKKEMTEYALRLGGDVTDLSQSVKVSLTL